MSLNMDAYLMQIPGINLTLQNKNTGDNLLMMSVNKQSDTILKILPSLLSKEDLNQTNNSKTTPLLRALTLNIFTLQKVC